MTPILRKENGDTFKLSRAIRTKYWAVFVNERMVWLVGMPREDAEAQTYFSNGG
jgi:hypothetical protein